MSAEINQKDYQLGIYAERLRTTSIIAESMKATYELLETVATESSRRNLLDRLGVLHSLNLKIAESDYESDPEKWEL